MGQIFSTAYRVIAWLGVPRDLEIDEHGEGYAALIKIYSWLYLCDKVADPHATITDFVDLFQLYFSSVQQHPGFVCAERLLSIDYHDCVVAITGTICFAQVHISEERG